MSQRINQEYQMSATTILRTLINMMNEFKKQKDHKDKLNDDKRLLNFINETKESPVWLETNQNVLKRIRGELERLGVPYMQFDVANSNNGFLIFPTEYKEVVKNIEKGIRIRAGLEIDTPEELEHMIKLTNPNEQLCEIKNVDILVATKVLEMAKGKNEDFPNVTVVKDAYTKEELNSLTYEKDKKVSLYCAKKDASTLQKMVITAALDVNSQKRNTHLKNEGIHYLNQQKLEIAAMLSEMSEKGSTEKAFIYSLKDANSYIELYSNSFSVIKGDVETFNLHKSQNSEIYADVLKFMIDEFDQPIYRLEHEVSAYNNGKDIAAILKQVNLNNIKEDINELPSFTDREIKNWLIQKCEDPLTKEINIPNDKNSSSFISCDELEKYLKKENKTEVLDAVNNYKSNYEKQLTGVIDTLKDIEVIEKPIVRTIEELTNGSKEQLQLNEIKSELENYSDKQIIDKTTIQIDTEETIIKENGIPVEREYQEKQTIR